MSKEAVDAICKVLLNFLIWTMLAAMFYFARGFNIGWAKDISDIFHGGIDSFPAIAVVAAVLAVIGSVLFLGKKLRAPRSHQNEILGDLIDEIGSVVASFGSALFFVAATNLWLLLLSLCLLVVGGVLFRVAIWAGA